MKRRTGLPLAVLLLLSRAPARSAEPNPPTLEEKTRQAEERVRQWEEEDRRLERRARWEVPLAAACFIAGGALASKNKVYAYSGAFAAGTGLTFHFLGTRGSTSLNASLSSGQ